MDQAAARRTSHLQLRLRRPDLAYKGPLREGVSTAQLALAKNCVKSAVGTFDGSTLALTPRNHCAEQHSFGLL